MIKNTIRNQISTELKRQLRVARAKLSDVINERIYEKDELTGDIKGVDSVLVDVENILSDVRQEWRGNN